MAPVATQCGANEPCRKCSKISLILLPLTSFRYKFVRYYRFHSEYVEIFNIFIYSSGFLLAILSSKWLIKQQNTQPGLEVDAMFTFLHRERERERGFNNRAWARSVRESAWVTECLLPACLPACRVLNCRCIAADVAVAVSVAAVCWALSVRMPLAVWLCFICACALPINGQQRLLLLAKWRSEFLLFVIKNVNCVRGVG